MIEKGVALKLTPQLRALLVSASLLAAACGGKKTFVEVKIQPGASVPAGIKKLDVQLTLNGATVSTPLTEKDGADISFPTSASFEIRTGSGAMTIVVSAEDQAGQEIDLGTSTGSVVSGGVNLFEVHMQGGVASLVFDRPSADLGSAAVASTTAVSTLTVKNPGPVATGTVQLHFDEQSSPFSIAADTCSTKPLAAGASCTVGVAYTPIVGGARTTTLRAVAAPGGTGEIALNATGLWVLTVGTRATGSSGGSIKLGGAAFCGSGCTLKTAMFPNGGSVTLTAVPDAGSAFGGWGGDCQGTSTSCTLTFDRSHSVSASWLQQVALTVSVSGGGAGTVSSDKPGISSCGSPTGGTCAAGYDLDQQVTLTTTPASGSRVGTWTGCVPTGNTCMVKLSSATSVGVSFVKIYNLTVALAGSGSGTVTPSPASASSCGANCYTYDAQTTVNLSADAAPWSRFVGWSGASCPGTAPQCSITLGADTTLTATFNSIYTVSVTRPTAGGSVTSTPAGINCSANVNAPCSATFDSSTSVTLSALSDSTARFGGWGTSGCTPTPNGSSCAIASLGSDTSISASFITIYPLSIAVAGSSTGAGSVTSNPAGINCPSTACSTTFDSGTVVNLTATPGDSFTRVILSGDCTASPAPGVATTCSVTMSAARAVAVTSNRTTSITINKGGPKNDTITSPSGLVNCGPSCGSQTFTADVGTQVTLQARPANGSGVVFRSWSGICAGSTFHDCTFTATSSIGSAIATFALQTYNIVFVSSQTFAANLGGARAYDTSCNQLATAAGINNAGGTAFVAWMSDGAPGAAGASNAGAQLVKAVSGARGWARVDGAPFSDLPSDFELNNKVYNPISVDETGAPAMSGSAWTGTDGQGNTSGQNCTNWTNNAPPPANATTCQGPLYTAGSVLGGPQSWTAASGGCYCNIPQRIYCFENDRSTALAVTATTGKLMFISPETFSLTAGGGSSADAFCKQSAPTGNTSPWKALLSTATMPASSVLVQAQTYVSKDGIVIGTGAQIAAGTPLTGIWQRADGTYAANFPHVWSGANLPSQLGTSTTTCSDWSDPTAAGGNGFVGEADDTNWFFKFVTGGDACSKKTNAVYCVEQ
jgi:hypothetical protein